ncbi:MAG: response regulator [Bacteroides sp.]|nr:response regulator [Bacteroides sp.]MCM1548721.1 response regulator [Clostridium sp.]
MKYKILVSGNNSSLITDFIQRTETFFQSLSTTSCWQDLVGHFELFKPDAYVCFVSSEHSSILPQISDLKKNAAYNGASIFLICDAKTYDELATRSLFMADVDLIIRRPISMDNLVLQIMGYFDEKNESQAKAVEQNAAMETKDAAVITKENEKEKTAVARENEEGKTAVLATDKEEERIAVATKKPERKHILVIDDDRIILKMLKTALSDTYDVTVMVSGVSAEKFLESSNIDLIILDYEMPGETGAEVFRRIKRNPKISHIPVCFLTGVSERGKIMEIMALRPRGYLLKPIDMDKLFAMAANLIN